MIEMAEVNEEEAVSQVMRLWKVIPSSEYVGEALDHARVVRSVWHGTDKSSPFSFFLSLFRKPIKGNGTNYELGKTHMEKLIYGVLTSLARQDFNSFPTKESDSSEVRRLLEEFQVLYNKQDSYKYLSALEDLLSRAREIYNKEMMIAERDPHARAMLFGLERQLSNGQYMICRLQRCMKEKIPGVGILIIGSPGGGKSTYGNNLARILAAEIEEEGFKIENPVYTMNANVKYADGFQGQEIIRVDDVGVNGNSEAIQVFIDNLMSIANPSPHLLNMADLTEKGKVLQPRFFVWTANPDNLLEVVKNAKPGDALARRIDVLMEFGPVRREYADARGFVDSTKVEQFHGEPLGPTCEWYRIGLMDPRTKRMQAGFEEFRYDDPVVDGVPYYIRAHNRMIQLVVKKHHSNQRNKGKSEIAAAYTEKCAHCGHLIAGCTCAPVEVQAESAPLLTVAGVFFSSFSKLCSTHLDSILWVTYQEIEYWFPDILVRMLDTWNIALPYVVKRRNPVYRYVQFAWWTYYISSYAKSPFVLGVVALATRLVFMLTGLWAVPMAVIAIYAVLWWTLLMNYVTLKKRHRVLNNFLCHDERKCAKVTSSWWLQFLYESRMYIAGILVIVCIMVAVYYDKEEPTEELLQIEPEDSKREKISSIPDPTVVMPEDSKPVVQAEGWFLKRRPQMSDVHPLIVHREKPYQELPKVSNMTAQQIQTKFERIMVTVKTEWDNVLCYGVVVSPGRIAIPKHTAAHLSKHHEKVRIEFVTPGMCTDHKLLTPNQLAKKLKPIDPVASLPEAEITLISYTLPPTAMFKDLVGECADGDYIDVVNKRFVTFFRHHCAVEDASAGLHIKPGQGFISVEPISLGCGQCGNIYINMRTGGVLMHQAGCKYPHEDGRRIVAVEITRGHYDWIESNSSALGCVAESKLSHVRRSCFSESCCSGHLTHQGGHHAFSRFSPKVRDNPLRTAVEDIFPEYAGRAQPPKILGTSATGNSATIERFRRLQRAIGHSRVMGFPPDLLNRAKTMLKKHMPKFRAGILKWDAVYNGDRKIKLGSMDMSTSAGSGCEGGLPGSKNKYFELRPSGGYAPKEDVIAISDQIENELRMDSLTMVSRAQLKNEVLMKEKDVRIFYMSAIKMIMLVRRIIGGLLGTIDHASSCISVGLNPTDADAWIRHAFGTPEEMESDHFTALDYKNFDMNLHMSTKSAVADLIVEQAMDSGLFDHSGIRELKLLMKLFMFPEIEVLRDVVVGYHVLPSGIPGTSLFGGLCASFQFCVAYIHCRLIKGEVPESPKCITAYGDDILVRARAGHIDQPGMLEFLLEYGIIATDAAKNTEGVAPYCTWDKVDFLKRSLVHLPDEPSPYRLVLQRPSRIKGLCMNVVSKVSREVVCISSLRSSLPEFALAGRHEYQDFVDRLKLALISNPLPEVLMNSVLEELDKGYEKHLNVKDQFQVLDDKYREDMEVVPEVPVVEAEYNLAAFNPPQSNPSLLREGTLAMERALHPILEESEEVKTTEVEMHVTQRNTVSTSVETTVSVGGTAHRQNNKAKTSCMSWFTRLLKLALFSSLGFSCTSSSPRGTPPTHGGWAIGANRSVEWPRSTVNKQAADNLHLAGTGSGLDSHNYAYDKDRADCYQSEMTLGDYYGRSFLLKQLSIAPGVKTYDVSDPWSLFWNSPSVLEKMKYFGRISHGLELTFVVNANAFHYGKLIASFDPLNGFGDEFDLPTSGNSAQASVLHMANPHIEIELRGHAEAKMRLPPMFIRPSLATNQLPGSYGMGALTVFTLNNLQSANGSLDNVDVSIYARALDLEMDVPTQTVPAVSFQAEGRTIVKNIKTAIKKAEETLSRASTVVEQAAEVSLAVGALVGLSRKDNIDKTFNNQYTTLQQPDMTLTETNDFGFPLTFYPDQAVGNSPQKFGLPTCDSMLYENLFDRQYFFQSSWSTTSAPGTTIASGEISPMLWWADAPYIYPTRSAYVGELYSYWRGELTLTVEVIASSIHRGIMLVRIDPLQSNTGTDMNVAQTYRLDLSVTNKLEIVVPWMKTTHWARCRRLDTSNVNSGSSDISPVTGEDELRSNGFFSCTVLNQLVSSPDDTSPLATVNYYMDARKVEFMGPRNLTNLTNGNVTYVAEYNLDAFNRPIDVRAEGDFENQPEVEELAPKVEGDALYHVDNMGETTISIKPILHRYAPYRAIQTQGDDITQVITPLYPVMPGYKNGEIYTNNLAQGYAYVKPTPVAWLANMFAMKSGSMRVLFLRATNNRLYGIASNSMPNGSGTEASTISIVTPAVSTDSAYNFANDVATMGGTGCSVQTGPTISVRFPFYTEYLGIPCAIQNPNGTSPLHLKRRFQNVGIGSSNISTAYTEYVCAGPDFALYMPKAPPRLQTFVYPAMT